MGTRQNSPALIRLLEELRSVLGHSRGNRVVVFSIKSADEARHASHHLYSIQDAEIRFFEVPIHSSLRP